MAAEGRIRENLYQQMENLNKFAKFYTNKIKPLYGSLQTAPRGNKKAEFCSRKFCDGARNCKICTNISPQK